MPASYKIYQIKDFIKTVEEGKIDVERSLDIVATLAVAAEFHENLNIVIDIRKLTNALKFPELLKVSIEFAYYKKSFHNKIALIIADNQERIKRAELVKANLKFHDFEFEYFTEYEKAIDWVSDITPIWSVQ